MNNNKIMLYTISATQLRDWINSGKIGNEDITIAFSQETEHLQGPFGSELDHRCTKKVSIERDPDNDTPSALDYLMHAVFADMKRCTRREAIANLAKRYSCKPGAAEFLFDELKNKGRIELDKNGLWTPSRAASFNVLIKHLKTRGRR